MYFKSKFLVFGESWQAIFFGECELWMLIFQSWQTCKKLFEITGHDLSQHKGGGKPSSMAKHAVTSLYHFLILNIFFWGGAARTEPCTILSLTCNAHYLTTKNHFGLLHGFKILCNLRAFYLVNGARDEARDVFLALEDEREWRGEGGGGLDSRKHDLPNVCAIVKSKDAANLNEKAKWEVTLSFTYIIGHHLEGP